MKKIILLIVAFVLLGVLLIVYIPFTPSAPQVGADKDEHGCIASAGYTYSVIRKECVRLWEVGIALAPVAAMSNPGLVAYVVQNPAGNKVEVFLPGQVGSMVLTAQANPSIATWVGRQGFWVLTYDATQGWQLSADGDILYAAIAQPGK